jgi:Zn-dependent peptidase ImmA (M78 family)
MYIYLSRSMKLPPVTVPGSADRAIDLETTVQDVRAALGLPPDQPIRNLTRLLEHDGAIVLALPYDRDTGQDAFSTRIQGRPLIATLRGAPPDRLRHSLAHELGHLVLHGDAPFGGHEVEKEADQFAGAFLLPAEVATAELDGPMTIERLLKLKERWGISMRALVVRANALGLISTRTYQRWIQSLNTRYGATSEPGSNLVPYERPRALAQMAEMAWGSMSPRVISEHLHVGPFVAASLAGCYQQSNSQRASTANATVTHLKPADDA